VLEEAAKKAEACKFENARGDQAIAHNTALDEAAAAIRALANPSPALPASPSEPGQSEPQGG
jgi:hypothetical protein